ncbi:MOSC domain-containing protein [Methanobacterium sp.]|uniref:MOSC domain-containing protein n=1 Tax=Methanobacterium sp. TaxID=2164 RepID=UPI0025F9BDD0|nr:MOSC domain-containing protein [Methanobacterium sp.]MBI5460349.1 MOSC domain-containing protein [Methanobacterium sp.]
MIEFTSSEIVTGSESGEIIAVCTSPQKQTRKTDVGECVVKENHGLVGDAHSNPETHRQVSLLAQESIDKMRDLGLDVHPGDFAENITTTGIELVLLPIGSRIQVGDETVLEVTQIGKECHNRCAIYQQAGDCIMPREGIFARAITGGKVKTGDKIRIL